MSSYEYTVVPAPRKASAPRKVKGPEAKFASTLTDVMNEMAATGWEYQRAETLPCEERQGFTGKTVKYHSVLVFRRALKAEEKTRPELRPTPSFVSAAPVIPAPKPRDEAEKAPSRPDPVLSKPARSQDGPASEGFLTGDEADKTGDNPKKRNDLAAE